MNPNILFVGLILSLILMSLLRVVLPGEKIASALDRLFHRVEKNIEPSHIRWTSLLWQKTPKVPLAIFLILGAFAFTWFYHERSHVILAADAKRHAGETKYVLGKVCQIKRVREGKVLVDFGDVYPNQVFTAVFSPQAYAEVRKEQGGIKVGDWVSVHGIIDLYDEAPEIRVFYESDVSVNPDSPDYSPD